MFNNQIIAGSSGQGGEVQQSLKFNDDENPYFIRTPTTAGNRQTWSISMWVKRGNLGISQAQLFEAGTSGGSGSRLFWYFNSSDQIQLSSGTVNYGASGARSLRDPSAWYHILIQCSGGSIKHYINGELDITHSIAGDTAVNSLVPHAIFSRADGTGTNSMDGYLAQVALFDGTAYNTADVTNTENGVLTVKSDLSGLTFGTNGFHLTFQDDVVSEGFNAVTWNGNGATQSISGIGFSPDLVWAKERSSTSGHTLLDTVRGVDLGLESNSNAAELNYPTDALTSFDADGFSLGSNGRINESSQTYVGWCWDAGSGSPVSNTDGTITSTVKANPAQGFSITSFVGNGTLNATVGHGLSSTPEMVLVKNRSTTVGWLAWHKDLSGATYRMDLNGSGAEYNDGNGALQGVSSSLITLGSLNAVNQNSANMICYAFHSVAGYSSIGSYSGTGASGNAVTGLGFKPAWLMVKAASGATGNWIIWDNTRDTNDADVDNPLFANLSDAEFTAGGTYDIQFDSDGFTINNSSPNHNGSGGTYIYMAFADTREAAFWKDVSGQGNHWTPNNLDYRDSLPDSPANNFAVLNSVAPDTTGTTSHSFSEGNLKVSTSVNSWWNAFGTIGVPSGKYYWEYYALGSGTVDQNVGLVTYDWNRGANGGIDTADAYSLYANSGGVGYLYTDGSNVNKGSGWFWTWGDVVNFAFDADTGKVWYGINGTWLGSGDPAAGTNEAQTVTSGDLAKGMLPAFSGYHTGGTPLVNFGQDSTFAGAKPMGAFTDDNSIGNFQYQPPVGFKSLCTQNLPATTIIDGSEHFNTVLYTGNGTSQSITGVGFQPDFYWGKARSQSHGHALFDVVRGVGSDIGLRSDTAQAEGATEGIVDTFDNDGFTVDVDGTVGYHTNENGTTYAAWNWKAGGTAVSNTAGTITSQVSANVDAGFSIVSYTGTGAVGTVGHGLSSEPKLIIAKSRSQPYSWGVYNAASGPTKYMYLETTSAAVTDSAFWNNTSPTSSVWTMGSEATVNQSGATYIAYCFADVEGFSKVGSYTGNGSADGPFVYTGFRPAWVMFKSATSAESWNIVDSERNVYNVIDNRLYADSSAAESAGVALLDFTSNGFKLRATWGSINASGQTFIYLAFAEHPFKYSNAR